MSTAASQYASSLSLLLLKRCQPASQDGTTLLSVLASEVRLSLLQPCHMDINWVIKNEWENRWTGDSWGALPALGSYYRTLSIAVLDRKVFRILLRKRAYSLNREAQTFYFYMNLTSSREYKLGAVVLILSEERLKRRSSQRDRPFIGPVNRHNIR